MRSHQMIQALRKAGFEVDHQTGAHVALYRAADRRRVIAPRHSRDLGRGLLRKIIADAGLTREEFEALL